MQSIFEIVDPLLFETRNLLLNELGYLLVLQFGICHPLLCLDWIYAEPHRVLETEGYGSPLQSVVVSNLTYQSGSALESYSSHDSFLSSSSQSLNFSTDKMSVFSMWKQAMSNQQEHNQRNKRLTRTELISREYSSNTAKIVIRSWSDWIVCNSCDFRSTSASPDRDWESWAPTSEAARSLMVCANSPVAVASSACTSISYHSRLKRRYSPARCLAASSIVLTDPFSWDSRLSK